MAFNREEWLKILTDYINYNNNQNAPLHSLRYLVTGSFYDGEFANSWLRDVFAGGVANNFFFKWFPKAEHGSFIYFLDALAKYQPSSFNELNVILSNPVSDTATYQNTIKEFIEKHTQFISCKYYLDLLEELNELEKSKPARTLLQKEEREAETKAKRLSKILAFPSALAEGFIDIMALLKAPSLIGFMVISWSSPATWVIFGAACFVSYYFYDLDSAKLLKKIFTGYFFQRDENEGTEKEPHYVPILDAEKAFLILFIFLSSCSGICLCALAMYSTYTTSLLLTFAFPPFLLLTGSFVLLEVVDNFIKYGVWNKASTFLKDRFSRCESCIDIVRILFFEIPKLLITLGVSIAISWGMYKLFSNKISEMCLKFLGVAFTGLSIFCASVTACMKGIFSLSKVSGEVDRLGSALTSCCAGSSNTSDMLQSLGSPTSGNEQESKATKEMPTQTVSRYCDNVHLAKNMFCITAHAVSQGVLFFKVGQETYGYVGGVVTGASKSVFSGLANAAAVMPAKVPANNQLSSASTRRAGSV